MPSLATSLGPSTSHLMFGQLGQLLGGIGQQRRACSSWRAGCPIPWPARRRRPSPWPRRRPARSARRIRHADASAGGSSAARPSTWWWCRHSWRRPRPAPRRRTPAASRGLREARWPRASGWQPFAALTAAITVDADREALAVAHRRQHHARRGDAGRPVERAAACRPCPAGRRPCGPRRSGWRAHPWRCWFRPPTSTMRTSAFSVAAWAMERVLS